MKSWRERTGEPTLRDPVSQLCTEAQFREPAFAKWCATIREEPRTHRKQWEYCWILASLEKAGMLAPGKRGLGFGVGRDPLAAVMASRGVEVTATDLAPELAAAQHWIETAQHGATLADLNDRGICDPVEFGRLVSFAHADMRDIAGRFAGYDFVWSSCAFEHLGTLGRGRRFVLDALGALKPGGIAVHTTEYNLANGWFTRARAGTVLYRRRDIESLLRKADGLGFTTEIDWNPGAGRLDAYLDLPPYSPDSHVKVGYKGYRVTSLGLVLRPRG